MVIVFLPLKNIGFVLWDPGPIHGGTEIGWNKWGWSSLTTFTPESYNNIGKSPFSIGNISTHSWRMFYCHVSFQGCTSPQMIQLKKLPTPFFPKHTTYLVEPKGSTWRRNLSVFALLFSPHKNGSFSNWKKTCKKQVANLQNVDEGVDPKKIEWIYSYVIYMLWSDLIYMLVIKNNMQYIYIQLYIYTS